MRLPFWIWLVLLRSCCIKDPAAFGSSSRFFWWHMVTLQVVYGVTHEALKTRLKPPSDALCRQMEECPRFHSLPHVRGTAASGRSKTGAPDSNAVPAQPLASPFVAQLKRMSSRELPLHQQPQKWQGVASLGRGMSPSGAAHSGLSNGTGIVVSSGGGQFSHTAPTPPSVCTTAPQQQPQQGLQRQPSVLVSPRHPDTPTGGGVRIELSSTTPRLSVTGNAHGMPRSCSHPRQG